LACLVLYSSGLVGCDDPPTQKKSEGPSADQPTTPPPAKPAEKVESAPDLVIDAIGTKVGFARINLQFPEGRGKLASELSDNRRHLEGKEVRLIVDRKAKSEWVSVYLAELGKLGVSQVLVRTETRSEFPSELRFTPESKVQSPAPCSVVAMILEDRGTAVWKLSGGVAGKRPKGMAGPDLTMTGETVERLAKACKTGNALFVAGAPVIEWGLIYDLAASTQTLAGARLFETRVLVGELPVPGHKVTLQP
jgi:hypothetical protein